MRGTVRDLLVGLDPEPLLQVNSHFVLADELEVVEVLTRQPVLPRPQIRQYLGTETHVDVNKDRYCHSFSENFWIAYKTKWSYRMQGSIHDQRFNK